MWAKVIKDFNLSLTDAELMDMSDEFVREINGNEGYPIMKGAKELINNISDAGIKLAVASSSGINRIEETVKKLGVYEKFDVLVSGKNVKNPKPAPDTFLKAAELLSVLPEECLVIEDSLNGMKAAKNANMVCVMYENLSMGKVDASYADYIIQGFEELDAKYFEMIYCHKKGEP
jgi:HAD superfamily hydrolase (TIGR01509 family)